MLGARVALLSLLGCALPAAAQLEGRIVSPDGALEGVVVSARKTASPVTVSVVSNAEDYVEYPLPSQTNIRRVFVDNSTTPPTFWVGNNHHATIVKVEPLD